MKRVGLILLTVFYTGVSMGVSLNLHYCGGKLAKVRIALPQPPCCCGSEADMTSCCSDAQLSIQMDVDQLVTFSPTLKDMQKAVATSINEYSQEELVLPLSTKSPQVLPMPPPSAQQLRILMGSLTYYG